MQRMRSELNNLNQQLDYIINRAMNQHQIRGDGWDQIADDATDAREKVISAMRVAKIERERERQ